MKVDLFDFDLPEDRIALRPAEPRENGRLLVVRDGGLEDSFIRHLSDFFKPGDLIVFNDTKVIPAYLIGQRGDMTFECNLHKRLSPVDWMAFAKKTKRLHIGDVVSFGGGVLSARIESKGDGGEICLKFLVDAGEIDARLAQVGTMPLPPYIASKRAVDEKDQTDYQTIFAAREGAVAAPTASLHFTQGVLDALTAKGVGAITLTLHVGAGTFLPVKVEDTADHKMHAEWGEISPESAEKINEVKARGGRVFAVGTTVLRLLESAVGADGMVKPFSNDTSIFITPGYKFKVVDVLMTNFHLPRSTLFMLVSAFAGFETMKAAYRHAIETGYRFYSYGDGSLLFRAD